MFLSIVAAFCDKDCHLIPGLLHQIETEVEVTHEVILVDNREHNTDEINFGNAKVVTKGYNAYQFEARRYAVQFCSGDYIWFIDADDKILKVKYDLSKYLKADVVCFNYMIETDIITLPYNHMHTKKFYQKSRFTEIKRENMVEVCPTDSIWDLYGCTLWNKWVKKELITELVKLLPKDQIIVASEDILYSSLILDRSKTICLAKDTVYVYEECLASGFEKNVTNEKFEHIIRGYDKVKYLFETLFKNPELYNDVQFNVSYFYTKLIYTKDKDRAFQIIMKYFSKEELLNGLEHDWIKVMKRRKRKILYKLCKKYL